MTTLANLQDNFVACRSIDRHSWHRVEDDTSKGKKYPESRTVARFAHACRNCNMLKVRALNRLTGEILFVSYFAPEGYTLTGAKKSQADVRKEYIRRYSNG